MTCVDGSPGSRSRDRATTTAAAVATTAVRPAPSPPTRPTTPTAATGAGTAPTTRPATTPPAAPAAGTAPTTRARTIDSGAPATAARRLRLRPRLRRPRRRLGRPRLRRLTPPPPDPGRRSPPERRPGSSWGGGYRRPAWETRRVLLRMSTLFLRTLRDDPADAEVPSHRLLVRAGYIRRAAPGGFTWLPLGYRVFRNVERVVREEMDAMGAQEVHFPALLPREPYEATGRWTEYGPNLFRLQDRRGQRLPARAHARGDVHAPGEGPVLAPTRTCRLSLYQIQTKYRDEARPRAGLIRGPRVHDEGQLLLRRRRRRAGPLLRRPPRRLHQDLRPAGPRLRDRLGDVGCDGRLEERGVPAPDADRRGHLRALARRLRGQRRGGHDRRPRRRSRSTGCPRRTSRTPPTPRPSTRWSPSRSSCSRTPATPPRRR